MVTTIFALLPIMVTILLGMLSAKLKHFDAHDSEKFIKLIMNYALPLSVFAGIWKTPRSIIISDIPLMLWLLISMVVCYFVLYFVHSQAFHAPSNLSALRALSVADPSIPFIGSAVLPLLFGPNLSAITIGISSLIINVAILPFVFGAMVTGQGTGAAERVPASRRITKALSKPLVIAALLGFVLSLCGLQMPVELGSTFTVLGQASGGIAMFATGIVLYVHKINFTLPIGLNVLGKNLLFPAAVWLAMVLLGMPAALQRIVVITLAIPTATMPTNLAIQYGTHEPEMASIQFWSTVLSFVTLTAAMLVLG
jgi:predicted permease